MKILVTKRIGFDEYTFETPDLKDNLAFKAAIELNRKVPTKCGACGSTNLKLLSEEGQSKKDGKNFTFIKIVCFDCHAFRKFGQQTEEKGGDWFFWDWQRYDPETKQTTKIVRPNQQTAPVKEEGKGVSTDGEEVDDLPF